MQTRKPAAREVPQDLPDAPAPTQARADFEKAQAHGEPGADAPPENVDVPMIDGTGEIGSTLTCTMGNWNNVPTHYLYQWRSNSADCGTGSSYVVQASDVGQDITCVVTAVNSLGATAAPPSNAITVPALQADEGSHSRRR